MTQADEEALEEWKSLLGVCVGDRNFFFFSISYNSLRIMSVRVFFVALWALDIIHFPHLDGFRCCLVRYMAYDLLRQYCNFYGTLFWRPNIAYFFARIKEKQQHTHTHTFLHFTFLFFCILRFFFFCILGRLLWNLKIENEG